MLGPLGTAFRDGEHQNGVTPPMTQERTLPTDRPALPQPLEMAGDHLFLLPLAPVTAAGNKMRAGARAKSGTDQEVGTGEHRVEVSAYVRSAVSL